MASSLDKTEAICVMASIVQEKISLLILASKAAERHTPSYVMEREIVVLIKEVNLISKDEEKFGQANRHSLLA